MKLKKSGDNMWLAVLSWLHILLCCCGLYLLTSLIDERKYPEELLICTLWLIPPIVLSWVFIRALRSLIAYLLCSFLVCVLSAWLSNSFLTVALSVFLFAVRGYARIKKGRMKRVLMEMPGEAGARLSPELWEIPTFLDRPAPAHWALFVCYYVICLILKRNDLLRWIFFLLLIDVFVCFLFGYLDNMWRFIWENSKIANLPVRSIQKVSGIVLLISVILLFLIVLPSILYRKEPLTNIRGMFRPIKIPVSTEAMQDMPDNFDGADLSVIAGTAAEPPVWLTAAVNVLMYLIALAAAFAALVAIWHICRRALSYFAQGEEDEIIFIGTEKTDSLRLRGHKSRRAGGLRGSWNQRVRKFYKKKLRSALKERPAGWETPFELERKAGLEQEMSESNLHSVYEKARYSREGSTEEEVRQIIR